MGLDAGGKRGYTGVRAALAKRGWCHEKKWECDFSREVPVFSGTGSSTVEEVGERKGLHFLRDILRCEALRELV